VLGRRRGMRIPSLRAASWEGYRREDNPLFRLLNQTAAYPSTGPEAAPAEAAWPGAAPGVPGACPAGLAWPAFDTTTVEIACLKISCSWLLVSRTNEYLSKLLIRPESLTPLIR